MVVDNPGRRGRVRSNQLEEMPRWKERTVSQLPILVLAGLMGALGGWVWATPALAWVGLELLKEPRGKKHARRPSHARSASTSLMESTAQHHRRRSKTQSGRFCCICLEIIPEDEPVSDAFDCGHGSQAHKLCIDIWLEKSDTCPLCRRDAKDPVLDVMRSNPHDAGAQIKGCRFISVKAVQSEEYQRRFLEIGAAELVTRAIRNHPLNVELLASAGNAVSVLAFTGVHAQARLAELGACELAVEVMNRFEDETELQSRFCVATYSLALGNRVMQQRLHTAGAPRAVLRAFETYMDEPGVAIAAAEAVMALACDHRGNQDALGRGFKGQQQEQEGPSSACALLPRFIVQYADDRDSVYVGLDACMKLAIDHADNRTAFGAVGMCQDAVNAVRRYQSDELFLLVALTAVYTLVENCPDNQRRVMQAGGAQLLVDALNEHFSSRDIVSVGLDVVFVLMYDMSSGPSAEHHVALREAGINEVVLRSLREYTTAPEVHGPALKAMACLLLSPENHDVLGTQEGCRAVCEVMAYGLVSLEQGMLEICCRVISALATNSPQRQAAFRDSGACDMVLTCLRRDLSKWEALEAVSELSHQCPVNRESLGYGGACRVVMETLSKGLDEPLTVDLCCMCIANLLQDCPANANRMFHERLAPSSALGRQPQATILDILVTLSKRAGEGTPESLCILMMTLGVLCVAKAEWREGAGAMGVVEETVRHVHQRQDNGFVVRQGLQLLHDMVASCTSNQDRAREAGAFELLADTVQMFSADAMDAARWIATVAGLVDQNPLSQQKAFDLGLPALVFKLLRAHLHHEVLLDSTLSAIGNIALNNRTFQGHVTELGACALVCNTIQRFPSNAHLQTRCSSVILSLSELERLDHNGRCLHIWKDRTRSSRDCLREHGAAKIFFDAIKGSIGSGDPMALGGLVVSLALIADDCTTTAQELLALGVVEVVLQLMQTHATHNTLISACAGLIAALCCSFDDEWSELTKFYKPLPSVQKAFVDGGAVEMVLEVVRSSPEDKGAVIMALIALNALCYLHPSASTRAATAGAAQLVDEAVERHRSAPEAVFYCLVVLGSMLSLPTKTSITECSALAERWSKFALQAFPEDTCIVRYVSLLRGHVKGLSRVEGLPVGDAA